MFKSQPSNARDLRDMGSIPRSGRPPEGGHSNPLKYSCLENPHGQRSLVSYSPWGQKESGTTEWLTHTHTKMVVLSLPPKAHGQLPLLRPLNG